MECHQCPHRENLEAGIFSAVPYDRTPCSRCELIDEPEKWNVCAVDDDALPAAANRSTQDGDWLPISVLQEMASVLMSLSPKLRDIVCLRFMGLTYREAAERERVTKAAMELRHRRAIAQAPILKTLFILKEAKRKRRHLRHIANNPTTPAIRPANKAETAGINAPSCDHQRLPAVHDLPPDSP